MLDELIDPDRGLIQFQPLRFPLGRVKHVIHERQHIVEGSLNDCHPLTLLLCQTGPGQQFQIAGCPVQWGADFMA
ncbi:hypothetical protein WL42_26075 [Burkholderia ubonensis]|nr:hypothetical protein WL42_26075 [Burkholderia ubonensis]